MASIITTEDSNKAMLNGLISEIRSRLRERIMERINPDIDSAIETALESFKASIETWRDPINMRDTIKVLIERKP